MLPLVTIGGCCSCGFRPQISLPNGTAVADYQPGRRPELPARRAVLLKTRNGLAAAWRRRSKEYAALAGGHRGMEQWRGRPARGDEPGAHVPLSSGERAAVRGGLRALRAAQPPPHPLIRSPSFIRNAAWHGSTLSRCYAPAPGRKHRICVVPFASRYGHTTAGPKRFGSLTTAASGTTTHSPCSRTR